jgi:hypothetical protein
MIVLNPENTTHIINFIPRLHPTVVELSLYNETTQETTIVDNECGTINGVSSLHFDFDFLENQKFQIKLTEDNEVVYRDKIFVTSQTPQEFKATKDHYYYE